MKKYISFLLASSLTLAPVLVMADVQIGSTRVIYNSSANEAALPIKNTDAANIYLVQSWVEPNAGSKPSFIIIPPLFRLEGNEEHSLRIIKTRDNLPKDRESQFWLDIKSIPSTDNKTTKDSLQLIVKSRLKLFYRPENLAGSPDEAYKKIIFNADGSEIKVTNPTDFYITFYKFKVNDRDIKEATMVAPKSSVTFSLPKDEDNTRIVTWQAITDSGSPTTVEKKIL